MRKKKLISIEDLIRRDGRIPGGRNRVYHYDTGWIKRSDWRKKKLPENVFKILLKDLPVRPVFE